MWKWPTSRTGSIILWVMAASNTFFCSIVLFEHRNDLSQVDWRIWTGLFFVPFCAWLFDVNRKSGL